MRLFKLLKKIGKKEGQQILEYAIVAGIVAAAVIAMSTYVYRAVQGTQQKIFTEFSTD